MGSLPPSTQSKSELRHCLTRTTAQVGTWSSLPAICRDAGLNECVSEIFHECRLGSRLNSMHRVARTWPLKHVDFMLTWTEQNPLWYEQRCMSLEVRLDGPLCAIASVVLSWCSWSNTSRFRACLCLSSH